MALITYGVVSPDLTMDVQMELSDVDSQRVVAYLMAATPYGTVTENVQYKVYDQTWVPEPGQTEADRPLIPDPDWTPEAPLIPDPTWVPTAEQPEAPLIPDPNWPTEAPLVPDASWVPNPGQTEEDRPYHWEQAWQTRPATPTEAVVAYAEGVMNTVVQQAFQWDQARAAADAAANVPPITPVKPPAPVPPTE